MVLAPVIAAFALAFDTAYSKIFLSKYKWGHKEFVTASFLSIVFVLLIIAPFLATVREGAFSLINVLMLLIVVVIACFYNILFFHGLKEEDLTETENLYMFMPLFAVVLAAIVFKDERNIQYLIPALIAAFALIFSHIEKKHIRFHHGSMLVLASAFLVAVESLFVKKLIDYYSPVALYLIRTGFVALILLAYTKPGVKMIKMMKERLFGLVLIGVSVAIGYPLMFYSYNRFGIVLTTLALSLIPVLVYAYAITFMKEKIAAKRLIAGIIILAMVVYVQITNNL